VPGESGERDGVAENRRRIEESVASLDKGTRLETVLVEEDEYQVVLSRGPFDVLLYPRNCSRTPGKREKSHEVKKVLEK